MEGEKDHPANGPTKMSNDKLGRRRKAKDKGLKIRGQRLLVLILLVVLLTVFVTKTTNQKDGW